MLNIPIEKLANKKKLIVVTWSHMQQILLLKLQNLTDQNNGTVLSEL